MLSVTDENLHGEETDGDLTEPIRERLKAINGVCCGINYKINSRKNLKDVKAE